MPCVARTAMSSGMSGAEHGQVRSSDAVAGVPVRLHWL